MIKLFLLNVFALFFSQAFSQGKGPEKHALLIAIGDYPAAGGWPGLSSLRDTGYILHTLTNQGFPMRNITIIKNEAATVEGIRTAFTALIRRIDKGDIVAVFFGCHGEQVEADNNNKVDGLDECIATYNAVSPRISRDYYKDQSQYLRGHVIGDLMRQLRTRLGSSGDLAVFMDNCHSGDGTRGAAAIRGGDVPLVSPGFDARHHRKSDSSVLYRLQLKDAAWEDELSSYEVISATRPEEMDAETVDEKTGESVGSLTYAVSKAFEDLRVNTAYPTYRALFARIQSVMNMRVPQQHPLLEGNGIDRGVFGGQFVRQMFYVDIDTIDKARREIRIKQGYLGGLDVGATIAVYPAGTTDTGKTRVLAIGTITRSNGFSAVAELEEDLDIGNPAEGWVFVRQHVYSVGAVKIALSTSSSHPYTGREVAYVRKYLADFPLAQYDELPELMVVKGRAEDSIKVFGNGTLFSTVHRVLADSSDLKEKLEAYARYKFLQSLTGHLPDVSVDVQLVPVHQGHGDTTAIRSHIVNQLFEAFEQDTLTLWVRNTGKRDVFVNILDLQPNGVINPILPNSGLPYPIYAHNLKIPAGGEYFLPEEDLIIVGPPDGTEVFKVFASLEEINVERLAMVRRSEERGVMTAIEKMIAAGYDNTARARQGSVHGNADASTSEYLFVIKRKKAPSFSQ